MHPQCRRLVGERIAIGGLCGDAVVAVVQTADLLGVATTRPADGGATDRENGVSFSSARCVRECKEDSR